MTRLYPAAVFLLCFAAFHFVFGRFFAPGGGIGQDFAYFFPAYLDNFWWAQNNGLFSAHWFSPAFCGGLPVFADPQSVFYSLGQLLVAFTDPLTASYLNLLVYSAAGYGGMYVFCRSRLDCELGPASLAAALWLFNGFTTHHYLVGHISFLPMLLAPVVACLLLPAQPQTRFALAGRIGLAGMLVAACVYAGLGVLMIPFALSVWALACLAALRGRPVAVFYRLSLAAGALALGIAAAKLAAAGSLMALFPRTHYRLPGIADPLALLRSAFEMLFRPDEDIVAAVGARIVNQIVPVPSHELALDLSFIPPLLVVPAAVLGALRLWQRRRCCERRQTPHLLALALIFVVPLAISYYSPAWNAWLKTLPVTASTTVPWRWLAAWLAPICAVTALAVHRLAPAQHARRQAIALAAVSLLIGLKAGQPREHYHKQYYDPTRIVQAWHEAHRPGFRPAIGLIGAFVDASGGRVFTDNDNDPMADGISQAYCYNPLFGYWQENFPAGTLHGGNPLEERDGRLNLKNPACYVFPEENGCRPGDHFRATPEDRERATRLLVYRPWPFAKSTRQRIAEQLTAASLLLAMLLIVAAPLAALARCNRRRPGRAPVVGAEGG